MSPQQPEVYAQTCFSLDQLNSLEHGSGMTSLALGSLLQSTLGRTEMKSLCGRGRHSKRRTRLPGSRLMCVACCLRLISRSAARIVNIIVTSISARQTHLERGCDRKPESFSRFSQLKTRSE